MKKTQIRKLLLQLLIFIVILGLAVLFSLLLARVDDDNNPFAMALFILAVAVIARLTDGYAWGITASLAGTFCVNYMFTRPFWQFNVTYPGYPLTFAAMLIVSILISALTTQIKKQEQLRAEMEAEKLRADLLRALAHDIRTPLAAITGAASVLQEQDLPPAEQKEMAAGISRDADWLIRITENLLSVTRVAGENASIRKGEEVLEEIVGSAVLKYRRMANALPVTVDAVSEIVTVPMDGTLIEQVLINLFDNVSAHADGATRIWLHIYPEEDKVSIYVEDNGPGLSLIMRRRLSEGTALLQTGLSDKQRHMGIGLSVCRAIIHAHGGTFYIENSMQHGGAKIGFSLPRKEENR